MQFNQSNRTAAWGELAESAAGLAATIINQGRARNTALAAAQAQAEADRRLQMEYNQALERAKKTGETFPFKFQEKAGIDTAISLMALMRVALGQLAIAAPQHPLVKNVELRKAVMRCGLQKYAHLGRPKEWGHKDITPSPQEYEELVKQTKVR